MKAYLDRVLALPLSLVVSASGLPSGLRGSSLGCGDMMQVADGLYEAWLADIEAGVIGTGSHMMCT